MNISNNGLNLIKKWEGLKLKSYLCPAKVWTIGYGHTKTAKPNMQINEKQAEALLRSDLATFEKAVNNLVKVSINQNQYDALVSLVFNIGIGAFSKSTLLSQLNVKNYKEASNQFLVWNKANGKTLQGLLNRRIEEKALFDK